LVPNSGASSWYSRWLTFLLGQTEGLQLVGNDFLPALMQQVMDALVNVGLVIRTSTLKDNTVWGLNPDVLVIDTELSSLRLAGGKLAANEDTTGQLWFPLCGNTLGSSPAGPAISGKPEPDKSGQGGLPVRSCPQTINVSRCLSAG